MPSLIGYSSLPHNLYPLSPSRPGSLAPPMTGTNSPDPGPCLWFCGMLAHVSETSARGRRSQSTESMVYRMDCILYTNERGPGTICSLHQVGSNGTRLPALEHNIARSASPDRVGERDLSQALCDALRYLAKQQYLKGTTFPALMRAPVIAATFLAFTARCSIWSGFSGWSSERTCQSVEINTFCRSWRDREFRCHTSMLTESEQYPPMNRTSASL